MKRKISESNETASRKRKMEERQKEPGTGGMLR